MNEARAWDQAGKKAEAADAYLAAARLFSDQEADDDLALALGRLSALRPKSAEVKEIKAKALYRAGKKNEAAKLLAELVAKGAADSGSHYTLGLILAEKRRGREGPRALRGRPPARAGLSPLRLPLRRAALPPRARREARDRAGPRALAAAGERSRAIRVGSRDRAGPSTWPDRRPCPRGDLAAARCYLESARAALPDAPEPAINLADLESREGRTDVALAALAPFPENAACRNQAGNAHARAAELARATGPRPTAVGRTSSWRRRSVNTSGLRASRPLGRVPGQPRPRPTSSWSATPTPRRGFSKALDLGGGPRGLLLAGQPREGLRRPPPGRGRLPPRARVGARGSRPPRRPRPRYLELRKASQGRVHRARPRGDRARAGRAAALGDRGGHYRAPLLLELRPDLARAPRPARPERLEHQGHAPRRFPGRRLPPLRQDLLHRLPQGRARGQSLHLPRLRRGPQALGQQAALPGTREHKARRRVL